MTTSIDPASGRIIHRRPNRQKKKSYVPVPFEGPPIVMGYVRVSTDRQSKSPADQRTMIQDLAQKNNLTVDAWYQDAPVQKPDGSWNDAQSGKIDLAKRPAGGELCQRVRPNAGDVVIVSTMDRLFRKLADCVLVLDRWERQGVRLLAGDFPQFTDLNDPWQKAMAQFMSVFHELNRKLIVQRIREAHACSRREKKPVTQYAGYGFYWKTVGRDPKTGKLIKHRAADPDERQIMKQIVEWRLQNNTFEQIYWNLQKHKVLTRRGTEWSLSRIIRCFDAELKLQLHECHINRPPSPSDPRPHP